MSPLLTQFLEDDCDKHVRDLLMRAIAERSPQPRQFTFNRFDVKLDAKAGTALLEDGLNPSPQGSCVIALCEFESALSDHSPRV